ncbi:thrombin inhibitor hemalin-like [Choristoneura fumiferana]|uniref:thrombin inhibitor hemalin-like n=1 Tax=Choristoneura fumiferana TaxID=7141 RepID=UPI003D15C930
MGSIFLCICSITIIMIARIVQVHSTDAEVNTTTIVIPTIALVADMPDVRSNFSREIMDLDYDVFCKFQPNSHNCFEDNLGLPEYYYDIKMGDCKTFYYGGCRESKNVFHYLKECQRICREAGPALIDHTFSPAVFCRFQPDVGGCDDYVPMYYFDLSTHKCTGFAFTGCGGNQNRFETSRDCMRTCSTSVSYQHFHVYEKQ